MRDGRPLTTERRSGKTRAFARFWRRSCGVPPHSWTGYPPLSRASRSRLLSPPLWINVNTSTLVCDVVWTMFGVPGVAILLHHDAIVVARHDRHWPFRPAVDIRFVSTCVHLLDHRVGSRRPCWFSSSVSSAGLRFPVPVRCAKWGGLRRRGCDVGQ